MFAVPAFGAMKLTIRRAGFLLWVERQVKLCRPDDGFDMMRSLLTEQVMFVDRTKPDMEEIKSLDEQVLNEVAAAVREAAGNYFQSTFDKNRPADDSDPKTNLTTPVDDHGRDSAVLWRELQAYYENFAAPLREDVRRVMGPRLALLSETKRILPGQALRSAYPNPGAVAGISAQLDSIKGLAIVANPVGMAGLISSIQPAISVAGLLAKQMDGIAAITAMPRLDGLWAITESIKSIVSIPDRLGLIVAAQRELLFPPLPPYLAAASRLTEITNAALIAGALASSVYLSTGFQTTAGLALGGMIPAGVSADVLRHFGEGGREDTPHFNAALSATQTFDTPESIPDLIEAVSRLSDELAQNTKSNESLAQSGNLNTIMAILTILMAAAGLYYQATDPTGKKLDTLIEFQQRSNAAAAAARTDAQAQKDLRFVHQRSPLRMEPQAHARINMYVFPDQSLRILMIKGDWAQVDVFTYGRETLQRGWVYRGNLRRSPAD